jgi:uncharacterized protein HemY
LTLDDGHQEIIAKIEKLTEDKPFDDNAEAIAALDWITATSSTLRNELAENAEEVGAIAERQQLLTRLTALESSIKAELKRADEHIPRRHQASDDSTVDRPS